MHLPDELLATSFGVPAKYPDDRANIDDVKGIDDDRKFAGSAIESAHVFLLPFIQH